MLSKALLTRLEAHRPWHQLAWAAGLSPAQLYRITAGIDRPGRGDRRIKILATYLGMTVDECFEDPENQERPRA